MNFNGACPVPFSAFWCPESGLKLTEVGRNSKLAK